MRPIDGDAMCQRAEEMQLSPVSRLLIKTLVKEQKTLPIFIPCSERMPERDSGCYPCVFIVWNDLQPDCAGIFSAYPHIGFYNWGMKGWQDDSGNVYFDSDGYVTHWFPMPAVPLFPKRLKGSVENG